MMKQQQTVRENQLELKSSLEDLKDTDKYRKVIEERNKEIKKKKEQNSQKKVKENTGAEMAAFPAGKPEIKVNPAYFEKIGRPVQGWMCRTSGLGWNISSIRPNAMGKKKKTR